MRAETAEDAETSHSSPAPPSGTPEAALGIGRPTRGRSDVPLVAVAALVISISSLAYLYERGMTNLYLDGIAHVNIARKVVDSSEHSVWRQYLQIGSPWLPVQTVLMLPLVANDFMWRTGLAGSFVSVAAFVVAAVAIYLLACQLYSTDLPNSRSLPLITTGIFILNPALLYMQATPMTESLFMAALAVAILLLYQWSKDQTTPRLVAAAFAFMIATLTRYEAWPVAAISVVLVGLYSRGKPDHERPNAPGPRLSPGPTLRNIALYSAIVLIGPLYWLWHNWAIFGQPFEFLNGPYSARGLYTQNRVTLGWATIFVGHPLLDTVLMLIAVAVSVGPLVMLLSAGGLARLANRRGAGILKEGMLALLVLPFVFHVVSLCRGEIQVFPISAFGLLNVRYGLPALLPIALFVPGIVSVERTSKFRLQLLVVIAVVALQYGWLLSAGPSGLDVYQEAYRNGVNSSAARDLTRSSSYLSANRVQPMVLMHTGALGPLVSRGGLRFGQVIHEGTARWHAFSHFIPAEISTVIVQDGDLLQSRLKSDPDLELDLVENFREVYHQGRIHIYRRNASIEGIAKMKIEK